MMTDQPSLVRRVYDGMTMFALLNIVGLVGLLAFLSSSGAINIEKVRQIVGVMRGDGAGSVEADSSDDPAGTGLTEQMKDAAVVSESDADVQVMRLEGERIKAELDQRLALNNSILLRVTAAHERFQETRDAAQQQDAKSRQKRRSDGSKKQIAIYEALSPKVAIEHMLGLPDSADAAAIFLQMDTRKAKKIIEAAKRPDEKESMMRILRQVRELEPGTFDKLDPDAG